MTEECRIKYIRYIQCKYSDLAQQLTNKYKLGRKCPELETRMLVVREYIKSLYCYNTTLEEGQTLDDINCLTEDEICSIVHHAMELTEDCNC
jgi:hypothetical protein